MEDTTSEGLRLRDDDIEDTVIRRPRGAGAGDRFDDVLGDTVIRPRTEPSEPVGDRADDGAGDRADDRADDPADDGADPEDTVVRARVRSAAGPSVPAGAATGLPSAPAAPAARVPSIRIGDRTFRLDHPVVIGRRPSLPRITSGPEPELVTVRSANGQVSSSHVRIHAEGEAVVVQDLRSTNGTVVRPAGAPVYRMASGASIVALTGTVVEVGDGNAIEVLSPYLRVAPTADGFPPVPPWPTDQTAHGTPRTPRERS
ncbi:FHA domain-containing protein [Curtobacterium sp. PhB25]|uniref:FHA domain-containing protein n=1 Tax=unclassified Curtobacterium TaxID=257496 RepID=UPI00104EC364|nr:MULTISPECIES: FHA domain-containing protein [unclassified Curtobacterium]TCU46588.1 FHA domain-containing protein [Curtobacterium sp. PhB146]TDW74704.1 FHA domain-containing protein [Curtobacterium sp. PhB25]